LMAITNVAATESMAIVITLLMVAIQGGKD
jgi:hypothetical protein